MKTAIIAGVVLIAAAVILATQITIFIVQPIGALPDGRTLIVSRMGSMHFIDSADAICRRKMNGVSLLCRGFVLGEVAREGKIYARLPYSDFLYRISTDGATYDR